MDLPDVADMPTYMQDVVKEVRTGRAGGISPGFRVPPKSTVPNAETFIPEVGNPDVMIRVINEAVMPEIIHRHAPGLPVQNRSAGGRYGRLL